MRSRRWLVVVTCLPLVVGSRCSVLGVDPEPRDLSDARQRWEDAAIDDYTFDLRRVCFCPAADPVRIVVRAGEAVSHTVVATGEPLAADAVQWYPTVEGLFDFVDEALDRDAHRIDATYDSARGFPVHIFVDYEERTADEEMGYEVAAFTVN